MTTVDSQRRILDILGDFKRDIFYYSQKEKEDVWSTLFIKSNASAGIEDDDNESEQTKV